MPSRAPLVAVLSLPMVALTWSRQAPTAPRLAAVLINADRQFAEQARRGSARDVYARMLHDDVRWQTPQGFTAGRAEALAAFDATPDAATSTFSWSPIRAGISADGEQGFTFGYMTQRRADGSTIPLKYMAYWVNVDGAWRVAGYKRSRAASAPTDTTPMPNAEPVVAVAPRHDPGVIAGHVASLMDAERDFAAEAKRGGLGNAFARFGRADAVNMGGQAPHFVRGNEAIAKLVSPGGDMKASTVSWGPDTAIVATSGDLGVTFGRIVPNGETREIPFFTIWRREHSRAPWRYIAE